MAKQAWVKDNGQWKKVRSVWVNVNGVWRKNAMLKCVVNGGYKEFMSYCKRGVLYYSEGEIIISDYNLNNIIRKIPKENMNNPKCSAGDGEFLYLSHNDGTGANNYISKISQEDGILFTKFLSNKECIIDMAIPKNTSNIFTKVNKEGSYYLFSYKKDGSYDRRITSNIEGVSKLIPQQDGTVIFSNSIEEESTGYVYTYTGKRLSYKILPNGGLIVGKTKDYIYVVLREHCPNRDKYKQSLICYDTQFKEIKRCEMFSYLGFNSLPSYFDGDKQVEVVGDIVYYMNQSGNLVCCNAELNTLWRVSHGAEDWSLGKISFIDSEKSVWMPTKDGTRKVTKTGKVITFKTKHILGDFAGTYSAFPENFQ